MASKPRRYPCQRPGCDARAVKTYCSETCARIVRRARHVPIVRALCRCGCGRRVKGKDNRWATPRCVPRSVRAANAQRGRKTFAYRRRARAFRADLARLGRSMTREDLLAVFQAIYKRGYVAGYHVCQAAGSLDRARERGAA